MRRLEAWRLEKRNALPAMALKKMEAKVFQAQILMAGTSVYSPWFERGGDFLRATVELVDVNSTGSGDQLTVRVFTKNKEDTTSGAEVYAGTTIAFTAAGRSTQEWSPSTGTGLKELVRYKFTAAGAVGGSTWVLFRVLSPIWFNAAK